MGRSSRAFGALRPFCEWGAVRKGPALHLQNGGSSVCFLAVYQGRSLFVPVSPLSPYSPGNAPRFHRPRCSARGMNYLNHLEVTIVYAATIAFSDNMYGSSALSHHKWRYAVS